MVMVAGGVAGGTMRLTSIRVDKTISRGTIIIVPNNTRTRGKTGNITRNTAVGPGTKIRQRRKSLGSSGEGEEVGQVLQTPGVTAVAQGREAAGDLKRAISVVARVTEAAEGLRQVTAVVVVGRVPSVALIKEEASVPPATVAQRVEALPRVAREVREVADHPLVAGDRAVAVVVEVEVVEAAVVGDQEQEIKETMMGTDHKRLSTDD